ncbi:MAG TPA: HAMP domain-containing sensor histidine kinase [Pyrinomonadaceae bacterium]|nr:HAMP domain-containing sensor histidine kinase [Pyrinomonadaceae bacterium]
MHGTSIRQRRKSKRKSDVERDAFLAVVSHELRNQINAILGWSSLMRKPATDANTFARGLEVIECNANLQAKLIEQLLDLSCVRVNCLNPSVQRVLLAPVLAAALDSMLPLAGQKGIQLVSHLDGPTNYAVRGDAGLLQQALTNLVGNAIKFTPPGGRIDLRLATHETWAEITVSDTGCGIRPEFLNLIFDPFKQVHTSVANRHGLGLGLTIADHIIATHKGTIRVNSPGEGKGTTFVVSLPLANSDNHN